MRIRVISYPASTNTELSGKFIVGHRRVLHDFGITNVTSNNVDWIGSKETYVIVAVDSENDEIVGGIRINLSQSSTDLPLHGALGYMDERIVNWIEEKNKTGVAEVCGLWNAKRVFGKGISPLLTLSAVALCGMLPTQLLLGIAAPYTRLMSISMGFELMDQFGDNGYFPYPNDRHRASLMAITDLKCLPFAEQKKRELIYNLRDKPDSSSIFSYYPEVQLHVEYNL